MAEGRVAQVIGTVVDVEFPAENLPALYNAVELDNNGTPLMVEVEQHIGNNWVRCLAMDITDGLPHGARAIDTGKPIAVPVGKATLGRMFNVLGGLLMRVRAWPTPSAGRFTELRRRSRSKRPPPRCWKPASRSLT